MKDGLSLLEVVQSLLERTYRMTTGVRQIGRFVIGDAGYRRLYPDERVVVSGSTSAFAGHGAKTLVRETQDGIRACIYYPDDMIGCLESHPPQKGLGEENVDAFAALVEEVDHLLCIAERAKEGRPVTLFELELHANVSKHLVLSRFLSGSGRSLDPRRRTWLGWHLFHKGTPSDEDPTVCARYRDATRWALWLLRAASRLRTEQRIETLRRFHTGSAQGKLELIRRMGTEPV